MKHKDTETYYLGEWDNRQMMGKGFLVVPHKYAYIGAFIKTPHGMGIVNFYEKKIRYQGDFKNGAVHGDGTASNTDGIYDFQGTFMHGRPVKGILRVFDSKSLERKFIVVLKENTKQISI